MNRCNTLARGILALSASLAVAASADAAVVVLDDFETNEGHFALDPDFSGSNAGLLLTGPGAGPSTADRDTTVAFTGAASEFLNLVHDPSATRTGFDVRFLSGSGTPANNVNIGPDGYVGFFARTTQENVSVAIAVDDGAALERSIFIPVPATGEFTLFEFNLDDADQWNGFAGTAPNGAIDGPNVTVDSIFIRSSAEQDVTFYIDTVAYNTEGDLSALVPEPSALGLAGFGGLALLARRRRTA